MVLTENLNVDFALLDQQLNVLCKAIFTEKPLTKDDRDLLEGVYKLLYHIWNEHWTHCDACDTPGETVDLLGRCLTCHPYYKEG